MVAASRSRSPGDTAERASKKAKVGSTSTVPTSGPAKDDLSLPAPEVVKQYKDEYASAVPYKYAAVGGLIKDELVCRHSCKEDIGRIL